MTIKQLLQILATSGTYEFSNIKTEEHKDKKLVKCNYNIAIESLESEIYLESELQIEFNSKDELLIVRTYTDLEDTYDFDDCLPDAAYEDIGRLKCVRESVLKANMDDDMLVIGGRERYFFDIPTYNEDILTHLIRECISFTDNVLLELFTEYDDDIGNLKMYYPYEVFEKRQITDKVYDRVYVTRGQSTWGFTDLKTASKIDISACSDTDILYNIQSEGLYVLKTLGEFYIENNETARVLLFYAEPDEDNSTDTVWILFDDKPRYVGINGVYTDKPVNDLRIGRFEKDLAGEIKFIPEHLGTDEYEEMCLLHITEDDYKVRKILANL